MSNTQQSITRSFIDRLKPGQLISSTRTYYKVQSTLREDSFGKLVKCLRMDDWTTVLIKTYRRKYSRQAQSEIAVLSKLRQLNVDTCNIAAIETSFVCEGHYCLEFEQLDKSLYDLLKEQSFRPLFHMEIRIIVRQVAKALRHLKAVGIIHGDLRIENVMLVDHRWQPYKVKLINFGLAREVSAVTPATTVQGLWYRSPEVMLGLPFTEATDVWSLGCMAALLYLGGPLYSGREEYHVMSNIVATQGQPADKLLDAGVKTSCFFEKHVDSMTSVWKFKAPEGQAAEKAQFRSLDDLVHHHQSIRVDKHTDKDLLMFVDMLKQMLHLDADQRMTPAQVLEHEFIACISRSRNRKTAPEHHKLCKRSGPEKMAVTPTPTPHHANSQARSGVNSTAADVRYRGANVRVSDCGPSRTPPVR